MITLYNYFQFAKTALTIGLLVAVGLLFWPGALATVANFSLFGLSIASYVGSNVLYQAGAVAGLTFVGLHALGITIDVVGGFFSLLKSCCCSSKAQETYHPVSRPAREPQLKSQESYQVFNQAMPPSNSNQHVVQPQQPPSYQPLYPTTYKSIYPKLDGAQSDEYLGYPKL